MTDYYSCGICKMTKSYDEDFPALSRKDNMTDLCSKCGQDEAMKEYELMFLAKIEENLRISISNKFGEMKL